MTKPMQLIEKFLEEYELEGVCSFFVTDPLQVILVFDKDWLDDLTTDRDFIVKRYRIGVRSLILQWFAVDVHVGSIVKKCNEDGGLVSESKEKKSWSDKVDTTFYEILNASIQNQFTDFKDFFQSIVEHTIKKFIHENLQIEDPKEVGELYRILKSPVRSHISKKHKELLKNRFKTIYQG